MPHLCFTVQFGRAKRRLKLNQTPRCKEIGLSYTPFTRRSKHDANVFKIHVPDVCSKFASCLLHRVNRVLRLPKSASIERTPVGVALASFWSWDWSPPINLRDLRLTFLSKLFIFFGHFSIQFIKLIVLLGQIRRTCSPFPNLLYSGRYCLFRLFYFFGNFHLNLLNCFKSYS